MWLAFVDAHGDGGTGAGSRVGVDRLHVLAHRVVQLAARQSDGVVASTANALPIVNPVATLVGAAPTGMGVLCKAPAMVLSR